MSWLELRIPPLLIWMVFAGMAVAIDRLVPGARLSLPGARMLAVALAGAGVVVAGWGFVAFRRAGTTVHPMHPDRAATVVSSGIYGLTRNPMYLGLALALLAVVVWRGAPLALVGVALFVAYMNAFQIRPEERALLAKFGPAFSDYQRRVRRWI